MQKCLPLACPAYPVQKRLPLTCPAYPVQKRLPLTCQPILCRSVYLFHARPILYSSVYLLHARPILCRSVYLWHARPALYRRAAGHAKNVLHRNRNDKRDKVIELQGQEKVWKMLGSCQLLTPTHCLPSGENLYPKITSKGPQPDIFVILALALRVPLISGKLRKHAGKKKCQGNLIKICV